MAKPKRRSLSERNAEAIAGAVDDTSTHEDGERSSPPRPRRPHRLGQSAPRP
ncbi:hypothetical protein [Brachybacterium avium]|uniref:hypothetical protein n=1 Tax=Brachybacterium avium TaxID=2017485 RepID=UPI0012FDEA0F|nr:hypothetical protein [Brachybacterium avium]